MEIKNLSQLKKALKKGAEFTIVDHWRKEEIGATRRVTVVQTNGIYSIDANDPNSKVSKANGGRGYWLEFGKASDWVFHDGVCDNFGFRSSNDKTIANNKVFTIKVN